MTGKWSTDPEVLEKEVVWSFFRGGGPGGQHRNKVETGVRLFHPPSGITVTATEGRSQYRNRQAAVTRLQNLLRHAVRVPKRRRPTHPGRAARERRLQRKQRRSDTKRLRRTPSRDE